MAKYIYPAIFAKDGDFYTVRFPDLESCYTQGDDLQDAYEMAADVLCLTLYNLEKENASMPPASEVPAVKTEQGEFVSLVICDTSEYHKRYSVLRAGYNGKEAYPVIMSKGKKRIIAFVPDFNINTQGVNYADAMEMARDAIGLMGIDMENDHEEIPKPSALTDVQKDSESDIVTLVDVDFSEYRRKK